jgi:hypothetical protein
MVARQLSEELLGELPQLLPAASLAHRQPPKPGKPFSGEDKVLGLCLPAKAEPLLTAICQQEGHLEVAQLLSCSA